MQNKYKIEDLVLLRKYIELLPSEENDIASVIEYKNGNAAFWYEDGGYKLVDSNNKKFFGDDELINVNDIKLSADELFDYLTQLPEAKIDNFYGMRSIINKLDM